MRKIQTTNISFRATDELKRRLTKFCEENDLHNSFVIRQALAAYLKEQMTEELPGLIVDQSALSCLRWHRAQALRRLNHITLSIFLALFRILALPALNEPPRMLMTPLY